MSEYVRWSNYSYVCHERYYDDHRQCGHDKLLISVRVDGGGEIDLPSYFDYLVADLIFSPQG